MQLTWEDQEESFCICFLGLFARIARLSQVQTFPHISVVQEISILIKNLEGGGLSLKPNILLGQVVRTPVSANPGLNFNPGFFFFLSKAVSRTIFCIIFRVCNHQIVGKEN